APAASGDGAAPAAGDGRAGQGWGHSVASPAASPRAPRRHFSLDLGLENDDAPGGEPGAWRRDTAGKGPGCALAATGCLRRPPTPRGRLGRRCTRLGGREGLSGSAGALRGLALGGLPGWLPLENEKPLRVLCPLGLSLRRPRPGGSPRPARPGPRPAGRAA